MSRSNCVFVFILLTTALSAASESAYAQARALLTCNQATLSQPQVGVAYRGEVSIEDYKLRARIPDGLTGWTGVANDAPFHGFTIFLDPEMHSCIVFEVHLRVDEDEKPVRPRGAKVLMLGNATAWQVLRGDRAKGPINITSYFSTLHGGEVDDGKVLLISRPEEIQKTRAIYDTFLRSVRFGS